MHHRGSVNPESRTEAVIQAAAERMRSAAPEEQHGQDLA